MNANETKKQHYVPRLYLRNFSHPKKNTECVYTKRRRTKRNIEENIEKVASENWYYRLNYSEDTSVWEKYYANEVEPRLKTNLERVIKLCRCNTFSSKARIITPELKANFSVDIAFQMLRGPVGRLLIKALYPEQIRNMVIDHRYMLNQLSPGDAKNLIYSVMTDEEFFRMISASIVTDPDRIKMYAEVLYEKVWIFSIIHGERQWISSDSPVIAIDCTATNTLPFANGIGDPRTIISFPLSSKVLLDVYDYRFGFEALKGKDCQRIYIDSIKDGAFIDNRNSEQARQCHELVFSETEVELNKVNFGD